MNKRSRAQILLQDEQYRRLQQIAMRQGRYISYVNREVIQVFWKLSSENLVQSGKGGWKRSIN